jgi:addiction module HigA family antidote
MNILNEKVLPSAERKTCPSHPGTVLKAFFLDELGISIKDFAEAIGVSRKAISAIVNQHKSVTPEMSVRFSRALNTSADVWLNLQKNYDLWQVVHKEKTIFKKIKPLAAAF